MIDQSFESIHIPFSGHPLQDRVSSAKISLDRKQLLKDLLPIGVDTII